MDLPEDLRASDIPNDAGGSIGLSWRVSPSDSPDVDYIVYISISENGPWQEAARLTSTTSHKSDVPGLCFSDLRLGLER
ncbi:MAG: fibronectin type III domain-containing protein, partial [Planctomycetota bacterium]